METIWGWYGGMARRECGFNRWLCFDADYTWEGVTDDYGNITPVSAFSRAGDFIVY